MFLGSVFLLPGDCPARISQKKNKKTKKHLKAKCIWACQPLENEGPQALSLVGGSWERRGPGGWGPSPAGYSPAWPCTRNSVETSVHLNREGGACSTPSLRHSDSLRGAGNRNFSPAPEETLLWGQSSLPASSASSLQTTWLPVIIASFPPCKRGAGLLRTTLLSTGGSRGSGPQVPSPPCPPRPTFPARPGTLTLWEGIRSLIQSVDGAWQPLWEAEGEAGAQRENSGRPHPHPRCTANAQLLA